MVMQALQSGCYWSRWALKLYWSRVSQPVSLWRKALLLILLVKRTFLKAKVGKNRQLNSRGHREGEFCFHTVLFFNVSLFIFSALFLYKGLYLCVYFSADWTRFFQEFNSMFIHYFIHHSFIQSVQPYTWLLQVIFEQLFSPQQNVFLLFPANTSDSVCQVQTN